MLEAIIPKNTPREAIIYDVSPLSYWTFIDIPSHYKHIWNSMGFDVKSLWFGSLHISVASCVNFNKSINIFQTQFPLL